MIQRRGEPALALEARAEHAVAGEAGREHLQRDRPIERHVRRAVDDAHPSAPGHRVDAVARERRADAQLVLPVRLGRRRGGTRRQPRTQAGIDICAAGGGCAHRVHELRVRRLLEHETARAARQRDPRELRVVVLGHDDHRAAGRRLEQLGDRGQARPAGHVEVEEDHVRLERSRPLERGLDVPRLAHDIEVVLLLEQEPQAAADHRVIVDEQDSHRSRAVRLCGVPPVARIYPAARCAGLAAGPAPPGCPRLSLPAAT